MQGHSSPPQSVEVVGPDGRRFVLSLYARGTTLLGDTAQYATEGESDRPSLPPVIVSERK
jgi:hypothetical protein